MRPIRGSLNEIAVQSRFLNVAAAYLIASDPTQWVHVPYIITLRDQTEGLVFDNAQNAGEYRFLRGTVLSEFRDRIPEVIDALKSQSSSDVLEDTIQRLGMSRICYLFGAQVRPDAIANIQRIYDMRHCHFRPVEKNDVTKLMRLRAVS